MSIRIMSIVWERFPEGGSDLLAMLALADWSDDDGRCYPSMAAISKKTRLSRSQAQRVVHHLIEQQFVLVTGNDTGGAPGSTRRYRINLDLLTGSAGATPTGRMDATGSAGATGRMDAQEGSHGRAERGRMGATQTVIEPSVTVTLAQSFDQFYSTYPKKRHRGDAEKAWRQIKPDARLADEIIAAVERAKTSDDWLKQGGQYIPYPATWLRARGWEDELPPPATVSPESQPNQDVMAGVV